MAEITKELGRIPVSRGNYQATTEYYKDNIVQYKRGSYQVVSESPIIGIPPTNDKNVVNSGWTLFAGTLDAQDVVNQIKEQEAQSIQAVAAKEAEILAKSDASEISSNAIGLEGSNVEDKLTNASNKLSELETKVIYDVSSHNNGAVFESLSALLSSSNLDTLIPTSVRHGGMSIRFIQSSDNKYVQYRLMATYFSTTESDWQGVDDVPTKDSDNLVKSGGMFKELNKVTENIATPIKTEKSYILNNGDINNTLDSYSIYSIHVNAGEQYHIIGTSLVGNAKRYAIYSSETPSSASCLMVAAESVYGNYDVLLEMPENAVLLVATFMTGNEASVVIKQRVAENKIDYAVNTVAQINQSIYYEAGENVDASIQSGKYILSTGAIDSLGAYSLKVIQVKQGEKYRIVGNGMKGSASIYGIYKNETMDVTTKLIIGGPVGAYDESYDVIVTIPYGGTTLAVTYMSNVPTSAVVTKIVEKSKIEDITTLNAHIDAYSMYCDIKNQQLILNYRCHGKIIQLTLKPTGGNNLFDFSSFAYKISDNAALSDLESGFSLVSAGDTDWHAPFQIQSVNNVDGDNISDGVYRVYFTGGNHQYNNSGGGSTSTARLVSLAFFVDGKSVSDFKGYCTNIRIEWVNNVQGYNTTKADGTGREILQERHIMELGVGEIKERIVLTPLEDIKISLWYGVQAFAQSVNSIEFIGSDNRQTTNSANINSISKRCRRMQLNRDSISVGIEIDESLDLGTRDKVTANNNFGAFRSGSGDKYYCQIINASVEETYAANANYYLNCKWFFD